MENLFLDPTLILLIAAFAGFFMAFGIGANDVANAMGTSVGSKAITFKQAIFIASIKRTNKVSQKFFTNCGFKRIRNTKNYILKNLNEKIYK